MMPGRALFCVLVLVAAGTLAACVPESDLERASGGRNSDRNFGSLTPIPEDGLPAVPDLQLRVLSIDTERSASRVAIMVSLGAGIDDRIEFAGTGTVEWSDGETSNALPIPGGDLLIESRRTDASGEAVPLTLNLANVTWKAGTDENAEIASDQIVTEWGSFPVLSIETASRPPGYWMNYQAVGQRWISRAQVRWDGRVYVADGSAGSFDEDFRPITGSLRFGTEFDDMESDLPLRASVDVRVAIPELSLDLR
jgi:hypothetical protein